MIWCICHDDLERLGKISSGEKSSIRFFRVRYRRHVFICRFHWIKIVRCAISPSPIGWLTSLSCCDDSGTSLSRMHVAFQLFRCRVKVSYCFFCHRQVLLLGVYNKINPTKKNVYNNTEQWLLQKEVVSTLIIFCAKNSLQQITNRFTTTN
jgi:hypothetical protein